MRILGVIALAIVCFIGGAACATRPLPKQIPETMKAACDLYTKAKPDVIAAREYAKAHWDTIPADWKPFLLKLDSYLPALDEGGQAICAASAVVETFNGQTLDWDDVLSKVLKAVAIAIELKQKGAI